MLQFNYDNDFKFTIKPKLNDELIDLTKLKDLSLIFKNNIHGFSFTPIWKLTDAGIDIEVQKEMIKWMGVYNVYITYRRPDDTFSDFFQDIKVGPPVFEIVPVERAIGKEDAAIIEISPIFKGDKGDKGDSAYQVWLDAGNIGTEEDYFAYLRQPAIDAGASISELEGEIQVNEDLRVSAESERDLSEGTRIQAENERVAAEIIRQSNEDNRIENEATRVQNEAERISKEGIRQSNEIDRVEAEGVRVQAENERVQAEVERQATIQEAITATNLANEKANLANTAAQSANEAADSALTATQEATTAASLADTARLAIQDDLALKANQTDLEQLESEVSQLNSFVAGYTYNLNQEVSLDSVDLATGTFTAPLHGLANGDVVAFAKNSTTIIQYNPLYFLPKGLMIKRYFVVNATVDSFQLSSTSGGAALAMTTNETMDLSKVHIEKLSTKSLSISNLPANQRYKVRAKINCTTLSAGLQIKPNTYTHYPRWLNTRSSAMYGGFSYFDVVNNASNYIAVEVDFFNVGTTKMVNCNGISVAYTSEAGLTSYKENISMSDAIPTTDSGITYISATCTSVDFYILNGSEINVYKL